MALGEKTQRPSLSKKDLNHKELLSEAETEAASVNVNLRGKMKIIQENKVNQIATLKIYLHTQCQECTYIVYSQHLTKIPTAQLKSMGFY